MITTWLAKLRTLLGRSRPKRVIDATRLAVLREYYQQQARMGASLFGPLPQGTTREFFCLDARTWLWHEAWTDDAGRRQVVTTRYDVRPDGIYKTQGNAPACLLDITEARNLQATVHLYCDKLEAQSRTTALPQMA